MNVREKIEKLTLEKRSLPDCVRKREIETEISDLKSKIEANPLVLVQHAGKDIGKLHYNTNESSWVFKNNDGSQVEVGFSYEEARTWASVNGFQLKARLG